MANGVLLAVAATVLPSNMRDTVYASDATFVVRADIDDAAGLIRATAALGSTDEIASTYALIATSDTIRDEATAATGLGPADADAVDVQASAVPGTNVLTIAARSEDPDLAFDTAVSIGRATAQYVEDLGDGFALTPLDPANLYETTALRSGTIVMGAIIGLVGGFLLSIAAERRFPADRRATRLRNIFDPRIPAHSPRYFELRLEEEVERSRETGERFGLGTLDLVRRQRWDDQESEPADLDDDELTHVAVGIQSELRPQDVLCHLGHGRFAAILPGLDLAAAQAAVYRWRRQVSDSLLRDDPGRNVAIVVHACEFDSYMFFGDAEAERLASVQ